MESRLYSRSYALIHGTTIYIFNGGIAFVTGDGLHAGQESLTSSGCMGVSEPRGRASTHEVLVVTRMTGPKDTYVIKCEELYVVFSTCVKFKENVLARSDEKHAVLAYKAGGFYTKTHTDFGYTINDFRSNKKLDTKPKTQTNFGYTIKALRSEKKIGTNPKTHTDIGFTIKALRRKKKLDTKPKTHTDFSYTIKALRSKKKLG
ncbi:unnamed protein product [Arabidopsis thaliana]|uniref:Uncharacterized protein n=1 Tax=Arabidopsis thaliana TaxID=3702 RepID=A0A5S9XQ33_ARATH|nr:unnamed protein product [Arabidopsis thaliana]